MEEELKTQLARELCAILDGWSQTEAAAILRTSQSELSRLRAGDVRRFSVTRLLRYISGEGYDIEVHIKAMPRRFGKPHISPSARVVRFDRYGNVVSGGRAEGVPPKGV